MHLIKIFDQKITKNQTFSFKGSSSFHNNSNSIDSEVMYKEMVKEHQRKNNGIKKKDFTNEEKIFEDAFNWKNSLSQKMNLSR